jgi:hypothetical protein
MAMEVGQDWFFGEAQERFLASPELTNVAIPLPRGAAAEMDAPEAEGWPCVIEGEPAGREFARKYRGEIGAEWEVLEENLALRLLACSAFDVPAVIAAMKKGETFRTRFAEYRLVK